MSHRENTDTDEETGGQARDRMNRENNGNNKVTGKKQPGAKKDNNAISTYLSYNMVILSTNGSRLYTQGCSQRSVTCIGHVTELKKDHF